MDLTEIGWVSMDWMHLAQDRDQWRALVNTVMNLRVPQMAGNFFNSCVAISLLRTLLHRVLLIEFRDPRLKQTGNVQIIYKRHCMDSAALSVTH
jgi:hypothetical protein